MCSNSKRSVRIRTTNILISARLASKMWTPSGRGQFVKPFLRMRGLFLVAIPLLLVATVNADTLILRDGRRVQGQLISFQNGVIEFQENGFGGRLGRVNRDEVVGIEFGRSERDGRFERDESPPTSQGGRPRGLREKQIMVVANAAWTDTGVDVTSGQSIYLESRGEIRWGPNRRAGSNGEENSPNNPARPMPNRPGAALIGRVGTSNDYFFVGDDRGAIRVRSSGRLFLGINDDYLQDNTGYFRVIVYY